MIVVADTSPLNYLILIEHIDVLPTLYTQVLIPPAVENELCDPSAPHLVRRWITHPPAWLEVRSPVPTFPLSDLLGAGETEAIALADQIGCTRILMDETLGRKEAILHGLEVIGTIGLLREAHRAGLLNLADALNRLEKTNFKISPQILSSVLKSVDG